MLFTVLLLSAAAVEDLRPVGPFQDVLVRGSFDVDVLVADKRSVVVLSDEPALVKVRVEKGALVLEGQAKATVRVSAPSSPASVRVSGDGTVRILGVKTKKLQLKHAGAGQLVLTGTVDKLDVVADGAGHVEARDARAKSCTVTMNGDGLVEVSPADSLVATVAGSGDVRYGGTPRVDKRITGSGSVETLGTPTRAERRRSRSSGGGTSTSSAESRASDNVRALDPLRR